MALGKKSHKCRVKEILAKEMKSEDGCKNASIAELHVTVRNIIPEFPWRSLYKSFWALYQLRDISLLSMVPFWSLFCICFLPRFLEVPVC